MAIRFPALHWSQTATSPLLDIANEYTKLETGDWFISPPDLSIYPGDPLHLYVQDLLNKQLKSEEPFYITYSSLWELMKDIGTKLAEQNGMFSKSLYGHNADVCNLVVIMSRIPERCSDKENDDVFTDLLIAVEAYYKKIDETEKSFKEVGGTFTNTLRFLLAHVTRGSSEQVSGSPIAYAIGRSPKQVRRTFMNIFGHPPGYVIGRSSEQVGGISTNILGCPLGFIVGTLYRIPRDAF